MTRDLPKRLHHKNGAYYYVYRNEWWRISSKKIDALAWYANCDHTSPVAPAPELPPVQDLAERRDMAEKAGGHSVPTLAQIRVSKSKRVIIGVYFLFEAGKVIYVGSSRNVMARLGQHAYMGVHYDSFSVVECSNNMLMHIEAHYIKELRPSRNVRIPDLDTSRFIPVVDAEIELSN